MRFRTLPVIVAFTLVSGIVLAADPPPSGVTWKTQQLSDTFHCEGASAGDLNRDGHADIISGPHWYEGPAFEKRHEYYPLENPDPLKYSRHFFTYADDVNGDGWNDIVVIGFPGAETWWFENPAGNAEKSGANGHWPRHVAMKVTDNESPTYADLTGDGKNEIVCSVGGVFGYASPDKTDPTKPWVWHPISEKITGAKFTHGMGIGDVNGDGRMDLMHKDGWLEQPASLGAPGAVWKHHAVPFAPRGGAQMYAFDIDGDGDNDIVTSLHAHGYGLVWYEQQRDGDNVKWDSHQILGTKPDDNKYGVCFAQIHAIDVADIDGDGLKDIIAGKRWWAHGPKGDAEPDAPAVAYWFKLKRAGDKSGAAEFVPYLIHDNSGVGTQVVAMDANGDGLMDVIVGNKKGTFVSLQQRKQVSQVK